MKNSWRLAMVRRYRRRRRLVTIVISGYHVPLFFPGDRIKMTRRIKW